MNTGIVIARPAFHPYVKSGWESNSTPPDTVESGVRNARASCSRATASSICRSIATTSRTGGDRRRKVGRQAADIEAIGWIGGGSRRTAHQRVQLDSCRLQTPAGGLLFVVHGGQRKFRLQSLEPRRRPGLKTVAGCIAGSFGKAAKVGGHLQPGGCGDKLEVGHPYCTSHMEDLNRNFRGCPRDGRVGDVDPAGTLSAELERTPTLKAS